MEDELEDKLKRLQAQRESLSAKISESMEVLESVDSTIKDMKTRQRARMQADVRVEQDIVDKISKEDSNK